MNRVSGDASDLVVTVNQEKTRVCNLQGRTVKIILVSVIVGGFVLGGVFLAAGGIVSSQEVMWVGATFFLVAMVTFLFSLHYLVRNIGDSIGD